GTVTCTSSCALDTSGCAVAPNCDGNGDGLDDLYCDPTSQVCLTYGNTLTGYASRCFPTGSSECTETLRPGAEWIRSPQVLPGDPGGLAPTATSATVICGPGRGCFVN